MIIGVPLFAVIYDICKKVCCHILKKRGRYGLVIKYKKEFGKPKQSSDKQKNSKQAEKELSATGSLSDESEVSPETEAVAADTSSEIK